MLRIKSGKIATVRNIIKQQILHVYKMNTIKKSDKLMDPLAKLVLISNILIQIISSEVVYNIQLKILIRNLVRKILKDKIEHLLTVQTKILKYLEELKFFHRPA